jgi:hypothetical protein
MTKGILKSKLLAQKVAPDGIAFSENFFVVISILILPAPLCGLRVRSSDVCAKNLNDHKAIRFTLFL